MTAPTGGSVSGVEPAVRILVVLPADPERMTIGGIASFIRGFVKFAPPDFEIGLVGITATRRTGAWCGVEFEGRRIRFLPVSRGRAELRGIIPIALRFTAGLLRHRGIIPLRGWVLSFHRPGTDLPFIRDDAPRWRVVHLSVRDLTTAGSESRWRSLPRLLTRVERVSFGRMDRIYVVNRAVEEEYRARSPELADRFAYLPNWADHTIFRPATEAGRMEARASVGRELDLPAGIRLLYAGRLEGQKNPRLLAETYAAVRARHPDASLLVAGEGSLESDMRAALDAQRVGDGVRFVGTQSREGLAHLMHAVDVAVITSRYETGPTVGFEALASGLPIAMTNVGQVARIVREHGAGQAVDEHSGVALADAVDWIAAQPADAQREATRAAVAPYLADRVLAPVYDENRRLAARWSGLNPA